MKLCQGVQSGEIENAIEPASFMRNVLYGANGTSHVVWLGMTIDDVLAEFWKAGIFAFSPKFKYLQLGDANQWKKKIGGQGGKFVIITPQKKHCMCLVVSEGEKKPFLANALIY